MNKDVPEDRAEQHSSGEEPSAGRKDSPTAEEILSGNFALPQIEAKVEAWLVEVAGGEKWLTTDYPERYLNLGYTITPLVQEGEVPRVAMQAVAEVRRSMLARHSADLTLLATIVERLKEIVRQGYDYDDAKIRGDLVKWGLIEPRSRTGPLIDTPEGARLSSVLELQWFLRKVQWEAG
ncbi:MAG: hypothetical protein ABF968_06160 [Acetobacter sp.]|uniref:hypothetical protein n=1 Tax=Acetobacter sp. TaxID=440 RepID=UPI0039ED3E44